MPEGPRTGGRVAERVRPIIADRANLTLRERLVLAHERGECHDSTPCPTCNHGRFMYRLGRQAGIHEVASQS